MLSKLRSFDEVLSALNMIPCLNSGGCGISALAMYMWLEKNKKIKPKILFCYKDYSEDIYQNNQYVLDNNINDVLKVPNHVMIIYRRRKVDSEGIMKDFKEMYTWWHEVDLVKLITTIKDLDNWNCSFNRNEIKKIENWLNIKLPIN